MKILVKKYSFLKDSQWNHFPSRSEIFMTLNDDAFKVQWKVTVLEEFQSNDIISIYHRTPSVGFKLVNGSRFQISLRSDLEFNQLVKDLNSLGLLNVDKSRVKRSTVLLNRRSITSTADKINNSQSSQNLIQHQTQTQTQTPSNPVTPVASQTLPSPEPFIEPSPVVQSLNQRFNVPSASYYDQYRKAHNPPQYHDMNHQSQILLNTFAQPTDPVASLTREPIRNDRFSTSRYEPPPASILPSSQPQQYYGSQVPLQYPSQRTEYDQGGLGNRDIAKDFSFLSQVLNDPGFDNSKRSSTEPVDFRKMPDEELKVLLREKMEDINFINFVERIEACLKDLR